MRCVYDPDFYGTAAQVEAGRADQRRRAAALGIENFDPSNLEHLDRLAAALHGRMAEISASMP